MDSIFHIVKITSQAKVAQDILSINHLVDKVTLIENTSASSNLAYFATILSIIYMYTVYVYGVYGEFALRNKLLK